MCVCIQKCFIFTNIDPSLSHNQYRRSPDTPSSAAAPESETGPCPRRGMGPNASISPAEKYNSNNYKWFNYIWLMMKVY